MANAESINSLELEKEITSMPESSEEKVRNDNVSLKERYSEHEFTDQSEVAIIDIADVAGMGSKDAKYKDIPAGDSVDDVSENIFPMEEILEIHPHVLSLDTDMLDVSSRGPSPCSLLPQEMNITSPVMVVSVASTSDICEIFQEKHSSNKPAVSDTGGPHKDQTNSEADYLYADVEQTKAMTPLISSQRGLPETKLHDSTTKNPSNKQPQEWISQFTAEVARRKEAGYCYPHEDHTAASESTDSSKLSITTTYFYKGNITGENQSSQQTPEDVLEVENQNVHILEVGGSNFPNKLIAIPLSNIHDIGLTDSMLQVNNIVNTEALHKLDHESVESENWPTAKDTNDSVYLTTETASTTPSNSDECCISENTLQERSTTNSNSQNKLTGDSTQASQKLMLDKETSYSTPLSTVTSTISSISSISDECCFSDNTCQDGNVTNTSLLNKSTRKDVDLLECYAAEKEQFECSFLLAAKISSTISPTSEDYRATDTNSHKGGKPGLHPSDKQIIGDIDRVEEGKVSPVDALHLCSRHSLVTSQAEEYNCTENILHVDTQKSNDQLKRNNFNNQRYVSSLLSDSEEYNFTEANFKDYETTSTNSRKRQTHGLVDHTGNQKVKAGEVLDISISTHTLLLSQEQLGCNDKEKIDEQFSDMNFMGKILNRSDTFQDLTNDIEHTVAAQYDLRVDVETELRSEITTVNETHTCSKSSTESDVAKHDATCAPFDLKHEADSLETTHPLPEKTGCDIVNANTEVVTSLHNDRKRITIETLSGEHTKQTDRQYSTSLWVQSTKEICSFSGNNDFEKVCLESERPSESNCHSIDEMSSRTMPNIHSGCINGFISFGDGDIQESTDESKYAGTQFAVEESTIEDSTVTRLKAKYNNIHFCLQTDNERARLSENVSEDDLTSETSVNACKEYEHYFTKSKSDNSESKVPSDQYQTERLLTFEKELTKKHIELSENSDLKLGPIQMTHLAQVLTSNKEITKTIIELPEISGSIQESIQMTNLVQEVTLDTEVTKKNTELPAISGSKQEAVLMESLAEDINFAFLPELSPTEVDSYQDQEQFDYRRTAQRDQTKPFHTAQQNCRPRSLVFRRLEISDRLQKALTAPEQSHIYCLMLDVEADGSDQIILDLLNNAVSRESSENLEKQYSSNDYIQLTENHSFPRAESNVAFCLDSPVQKIEEYKHNPIADKGSKLKLTSGDHAKNDLQHCKLLAGRHVKQPCRQHSATEQETNTDHSKRQKLFREWHSLEESASEPRPLTDFNIRNTCITPSKDNINPQDESYSLEEEALLPDRARECSNDSLSDEDTLSLELYVPGRRKCIRLHRRTFIFYLLKYSIFLCTFLSWVASLSGSGFGVWMLTSDTVIIDDVSDIFLDPYALLCLVSAIMFLVTFFGCIGALRENICLLILFHISLTVVVLLEVLLSLLILFFYTMPEFRSVVKVGPEEVLKKAIKEYFDNEALKNWIDMVQKQFQCCGVSMSNQGYLDWQENPYYNCSPSNPSVHKCSVPISCCIFMPGDYINYMCGAGIIKTAESDAIHIINTKGCMKSFGEWLSSNDAVVGYVALAVIIPQVLEVIAARFFVKNLRTRKTSWLKHTELVETVAAS